MSKQLIIGDLHFGKYGNSQIWLDTHKKYFEHGIFPIIEQNLDELDSIIFLGDIFDVRYSTNTLIGCEVKKIFRKLSKLISKNQNCKINIVAGNHDYYSPVEDTKEYNAYELVFGEEFIEINSNINIITDKYYIDKKNNTLFAPWYWTENQDKLRELLINVKPSVMYCHADILAFDDETIEVLKNVNCTVFSGHIHTPQIKQISDNTILYNIGAALPLDFNDANQSRCIYLCDGPNILLKHVNNTTIKFKTFYNEQIFHLNETDFENAITKICIYNKNIITARYIEQINYIKSNYCCDYNITFNKIEDDYEITSDTDLAIITNINEYINNNIPDHLLTKYNIIKEKLKEQKKS